MSYSCRALVWKHHKPERIRRGVFTSVAELDRASHDYIEHNNANPKPFVWTKSANAIIRKVNLGGAARKMQPLKRVGKLQTLVQDDTLEPITPN